MNETIKNILERRSTRKYLDKKINDDDLNLILECGLYAPSGLNCQNAYFSVVSDQKFLSKVNEAVKTMLDPVATKRMIERCGEDFSIFYNAPVAIFFSGDDTSCALAAQNMAVAAKSLGISSCMIGLVAPVFNTDIARYVKDYLHIQADRNCPYALILGYSDTNTDPTPRIDGRVIFCDKKS